MAAGGCASVFVVVFVFAAIGSAWAVVFNRITSLPPAVHHAHLAAVHHEVKHHAIQSIDNTINHIATTEPGNSTDESDYGNPDGDYNEVDSSDRE